MKLSDLFEIAIKGEGRYGSAQAINAKMVTRAECDKRIDKDNAFSGGGHGKFICSGCHGK